MPSPLTQYVFRVMQQTNLPVILIVEISCILPVYISHIWGRHHSELSGDVPLIARKGRVQDTAPYHLGNMMSHDLDVIYEGIHDVGR